MTARELFGFNLKRLLKTGSHSASGLAAFLKLPSNSVVYRWSMGKILPTKYLDQIAEYFDVPVAELFIESPQEIRNKEPSLDEAIKVVTRELGYRVEKVGKKL